MIVNPSSGGSGTIADGSITEAKLDAGLTTKVNNVGSVAEGSITSFHIATGSILGTDICGNTITYANIANNAVTNTKIDNGAVTHAKLSTDCVQSHNILDGTILGTDICGNTITGSKIAVGTITSSNIADGTILGTDISSATITNANIADDTIKFNNLDVGLQSFISNTYTGIFEITGADTFNANFYYEEDNNKIYLFQDEEITNGNTKFITYSSLPQHFATIPFYFSSDEAILSYSLTYSSPTNGIINHSQVGAGKIQFNILRNSQHYLEISIYINP
jgi:hypothetical protein